VFMFCLLVCASKCLQYLTRIVCSMTNEANIQIVIEAVDSAVSDRFQLSQLLDGVNEAHNQVVHLHYIGSDCVRFVLVLVLTCTCR